MRRLRLSLSVALVSLFVGSQVCLGGIVKLYFGDSNLRVWSKATRIGEEVFQGSEFYPASNGQFTVHIDTEYGHFAIPVDVVAGEDTIVRLPFPKGFDQAEFRRMTSHDGSPRRLNRCDLTVAVVQDGVKHPQFRAFVLEAFARVSKETGGMLKFTGVKDAATADLVVTLISKEDMRGRFPNLDYVPPACASYEYVNGRFVDVGIFMRPEFFGRMDILKHEIGHCLGFWAHSSRKTNVMYPAAVQDRFSPEEVLFLKVLYSLQPGEISESD